MRFTLGHRAAITVLATLALSSCASMSKDECRALDWRTVGYEDGAAGQGVERLTGRRQACAKHGVTPDLDAYRAGREEGLAEYCRPSNGFRFGARGGDYRGVCPQHLEPGFHDAYQAGRTLWRLESRVSDAIRGIGNRRAEVEGIDEALVAASVVMIGEGRSTQERAQALIDTRNLTERRSRTLTEIDALERALPAYEAELEDYKAQLGYYAY